MSVTKGGLNPSGVVNIVYESIAYGKETSCDVHLEQNNVVMKAGSSQKYLLNKGVMEGGSPQKYLAEKRQIINAQGCLSFFRE